MASGQGPGVNYLRQEIRGFMVLDGANANSSSSSSATTTTTTTTNTTSSNSSTSGAASAAVQQLVQSLPSETTTPASANLSNRLSRLPAQLQQQHFKNLWKHYLYELQQKAPTPKRVICRFNISSRPAHYGREFHGIMAREEADQLLLEEDGEDGRYLVRESARTRGQMTLSLRFNALTKNYRLFYDRATHYVNELKRFSTLHDLVADGLITLYMELHAADYIANLTRECRYEESPYMTLHRGRVIPPPEKVAVKSGNSTSNAFAQLAQPQPQQLSSNSAKAGEAVPRSQTQSQVGSGGSGGNSKVLNRRSMGAAAGGGIRLITSHDELAAPDDDDDEGIYISPCGAVTGTVSSSSASTTLHNIQAYEKAHTFRTHTFIGNPWCDYCGNFIWGLIGQGVRCDDCGFGAHRKCSELVPSDCCPSLSHIRRIFGIDLTTFVKASNCLRPFIVDLLVGEVERRGMTVEGIYRACGSSDAIDALRERFEAHWEQADGYLRSVEDVHVITGLLKLYLRLLPLPLITFEAYPMYIEAIKKSNQDQSLSALRDATAKLPPAHYQTLKYLVTHLNRVSSQEHRNLMSAKNLSLIFGQTLLYTPNIPMMFQYNCWELEAKVVETLIACHSKIFIK